MFVFVCCYMLCWNCGRYSWCGQGVCIVLYSFCSRSVFVYLSVALYLSALWKGFLMWADCLYCWVFLLFHVSICVFLCCAVLIQIYLSALWKGFLMWPECLYCCVFLLLHVSICVCCAVFVCCAVLIQIYLSALWKGFLMWAECWGSRCCLIFHPSILSHLLLLIMIFEDMLDLEYFSMCKIFH